jgi:hypothetical protein
LPGDNFNTVLYTGNGGGSTDAITGVGFSPGLNWIKGRTNSTSNYLTDSVRGIAGSGLLSDSTAAPDGIERIASLDSDGFTTADTLYSYVNTSSANYVAWNWKAGGAAVSNTDGSITSSVSANTDAGFSIVSYTSPGTNVDETVGHGLSQKPEMVLVKNLDSTFNWDVWTPALASEKDLILNSDDDELSSRWSATVPSASLVTLRDSYEVNGTDDYIAYCFHSVEGYSKVGTYVGNSDVDGPFVYTGFHPAFTMCKKISGTGNWIIFDNKRPDAGTNTNVNDSSLYPNLTEYEGDSNHNDFVSNGFKLRTTGGDNNESGSTYIYLALAESPFKTSNAR